MGPLLACYCMFRIINFLLKIASKCSFRGGCAWPTGPKVWSNCRPWCHWARRLQTLIPPLQLLPLHPHAALLPVKKSKWQRKTLQHKINLCKNPRVWHKVFWDPAEQSQCCLPLGDLLTCTDACTAGDDCRWQTTYLQLNQQRKYSFPLHTFSTGTDDSVDIMMSFPIQADMYHITSVLEILSSQIHQVWNSKS